MNLSDFLSKLEEGADRRGVQDGTGPYKGSAMAASGKRGSRAGYKRGNCPKREDFDTEEEYKKALDKWNKENNVS